MKSLALLSVTLLGLGTAGMAGAEPAFIPTLNAVTGVAEADVLNIRAAPDPGAPILGTLAPDRTGVEVTGLDESGNWGRIGFGEVDGWVSLRYLAETPFPPGAVPDGMSCLGVEPAWLLYFRDGTAAFGTMSSDLSDGQVTAAATRVPPGRQTFGFSIAFPTTQLSGTITAGTCSDTMSDRSYGWRVALLVQGAGSVHLEEGCCRLGQP